MKTTIYIFLSLFLCCTAKLNAQSEIQIDTLSVNYFNGITQQIQIVDEYRITNLSDEDYLTWVAFFPKGNKSNKELVHDFFKKSKGLGPSELGFVTLMYELEPLVEELPCSIGYTFIKKIPAGDSFSYFIAGTGKETDNKNTIVGSTFSYTQTDVEKESTVYNNRIVIMKRSEVEQYLRFPLKEFCFSKLPSILLIEK